MEENKNGAPSTLTNAEEENIKLQLADKHQGRREGGRHWKDAGQHGGKDAECEQGPVERCEDLQKQSCTIESDLQRNGGPVFLFSYFGSAKWSWSGAILDRMEGLGDKSYEASVQSQKKRRAEIARIMHDDSEGSENDLIAESMTQGQLRY